MNENEVFTYWSNILDELLMTNDFCKLYFQMPTHNYSMSLTDTIRLQCGVSKGCLIDDDYDYCVKFNLFNYDNYNFYHFCEREQQIYADAEAANLSKYFAEAKYIGTYYRAIDFYYYDELDFDLQDYSSTEVIDAINECINNTNKNFKTIDIMIPLFAYPKGYYHSYPCVAVSERTRAHSIESPLNEKNVAVASEFIRYYGFDEYIRLSDFLTNNNINDFHCGNAMDVNNEFVLTDYSGFTNEFESYRRIYEETSLFR